MEWTFLRTDSNNITIFFMQPGIINMLSSTKWKEGKVEFGEFADQRPRIFSQRVPGRKTVEKDGGDKGWPEKTKDVQDC